MTRSRALIGTVWMKYLLDVIIVGSAAIAGLLAVVELVSLGNLGWMNDQPFTQGDQRHVNTIASYDLELIRQNYRLAGIFYPDMTFTDFVYGAIQIEIPKELRLGL